VYTGEAVGVVDVVKVVGSKVLASFEGDNGREEESN
jgi:hypothetical protein